MRYRCISSVILSLGIMLIAAGCTNASPFSISRNPGQPSSTPVTKTSSPTPPRISETWKTYSNTTYGFSFRYPSTWTDSDRDIAIGDYFIRPPDIAVLGLGVIATSNPPLTIAQENVRQSDCPPVADYPGQYSHVLTVKTSGVLYVLYCSADTEIYTYVFKTSTDTVISMSYENDIPIVENVTLNQKLVTFDQIISSIALGR